MNATLLCVALLVPGYGEKEILEGLTKARRLSADRRIASASPSTVRAWIHAWRNCANSAVYGCSA